MDANNNKKELRRSPRGHDVSICSFSVFVCSLLLVQFWLLKVNLISNVLCCCCIIIKQSENTSNNGQKKSDIDNKRKLDGLGIDVSNNVNFVLP